MRTAVDYIKQTFAILIVIYIIYLIYNDIVSGNYIIAIIRYFVIGIIMFASSCIRAKKVPNPIMIVIWIAPIISQNFRNFMWKEDWGQKIKKFIRRNND